MKSFIIKFLISLLYLSIITFSANSEVVNKIEIDGNERISSETIIAYSGIVKGNNYEINEVNEIIKNLFDTGFFENVSISIQNKILKMVVIENPIINMISLDGIRAKKFKEAIMDMLSLKEQNSFTKNKIKDDINIIRTVLRNAGYYFVNIETDVEKIKKNRVNIIYTIDLGEKAKIKKIFFTGDKKVRDTKLRDVITSEENKFWKFISSKKFLNVDRIELDTRLLKNFYKNRGYYEVDITSSNIEYSVGEGFVLTFNINAGKRYKFKKAFLNLADGIDKTAFFALNKDLKEIVGHYYSSIKLTKILNKLDGLAEQKELQFINHSLLETLDNDEIIVQINVFESEKVFVEKINIAGNNITNDNVIRSQMLIDEGDPFSPLLLAKSMNELKSRNIFAKVGNKTYMGSDSGLKIIDIVVEEKSTGELAASAGVGTEGTSFAVGVAENNFMGRGVKVNSNLEISGEAIRGQVSVTNPNYNYSGNSLSGSLESIKIDKLTDSGYETTKTGFTLGTGFEQYEDVFISPGISTYYESLSANSTASKSIKKQEGNYFDSYLNYAITMDKRNQSYQPTDGFRTSFSQKLPIYSDMPSIKNGLDWSMYHEITPDIIGSVKLYTRMIKGLGDDVKLSDRLFLPSNRMRGFKRGKIGPIDGSDHVGGNYAAALNFQASLPNVLPEEYKTDFNLFFDLGDVWSIDYDPTASESDTLRTSIGINASILSFLGPLSFTFAQVLTKDDTDQTEGFKFNLGTTF